MMFFLVNERLKVVDMSLKFSTRSIGYLLS